MMTNSIIMSMIACIISPRLSKITKNYDNAFYFKREEKNSSIDANSIKIYQKQFSSMLMFIKHWGLKAQPFSFTK